ncbi:MAG TPA: putative metal-binding motif-containing protein [Polyangia bacterium]|nr:putative metal-binding motif-containing protein [Polyangia bacterium]
MSADNKVDQYNLFVRDDATGEVFFSTGWTPVSPGGMAPHDPTTMKLKIALKLSRGGKFTLLLVGVQGELIAGKPAAGAAQLFWAARLNVDGTTGVDAQLLTVPAGDDMDGDYWPDAQAFLAHVPAATPLYAQHPDVLDCDDKIDNPMSPVTMMPIKLKAKDINPFALEICGDGYDENCDGPNDEACVDNDKDHDFKGSDCDDNDPARHHPTDIDPFPDPPNCCGKNLGKENTPDATTDYLHAPGDPGCFAAKCMRDTMLCPMKRCGDGIDEGCNNGVDTTCIVDEDCDGYPAPPQGNDCDDHDPNVHPNAAEPCNATKDLNCDGVIGGCVPCDLDGDGFERNDPGNGCPDAKDKHPGMVDCNDYDSGVYPGSTGPCGGKEGGSGPLGMANCALRGGCRTVYESTGAIASGTPRVASFANVLGDDDCDGFAYAGCPTPACDVDGDGFPNAGAGCNPGGTVQVDCNDNDPTIFPGAPDKCGDGIAQNCTADTPCTQDADGDGYNKGVDCDDANPNIHPWAVEICDGIDNDCDGLTDEGNPDATGKPMVGAGAVTACTDSDVGECAKTKGVCVCSPSSGDAYTDAMGKRTFCPTENATPKPNKPPHCFGAGQPKPQSCDAVNPKDDDCDGRNDAPDGKNLAIKGMPCGVAVGQCKQGTIDACDSSKINCFVGSTPPVLPAADAWFVCSATAVCPVPELCNGLDDNCDGQLAGSVTPPAPGSVTADERDHDGDGYLACTGCPAPGAGLANGLAGCGDCDDTNGNINPGKKDVCNGIDDDCNPGTADGSAECGVTAPTLPVCCGANGCKNTQTDFNFCNGCAAANACNPGNSDNCFGGGCRCGNTAGPCGAGLTCTSGRCTKGNGASCAIGTDCTSNNCVDLFCCAVPGCGTCQACTGAGGSCASVKNADDPDSCTGANTCDSTGACKLKQGQSGCTMGTQCATTFCTNGTCCAVNTCGQCSTCANAGGTCMPLAAGNHGTCTGANTCDGLGNCKLANGQLCPSGGGTCASGNCVDGVCCSASSCATCQACNVSGMAGNCQNQPLGPGNGCSGAGQACNGAGACKEANGQGCGTDGTLCATGHCVDTVCCSLAACGTCQTCDGTSPGSCTNAPVGPGTGCNGVGQACDGMGNCKQANGTSCGVDNTVCATGHCTETVCCPVASCGTCQTCNGGVPGVCTIQNGAPGNGCPGSTCAGGTQTNQQCTAGACMSTGTMPCAPFVCNGGSACFMSCTCGTAPCTSGRCASGNYCDGANCTAFTSTVCGNTLSDCTAAANLRGTACVSNAGTFSCGCSVANYATDCDSMRSSACGMLAGNMVCKCGTIAQCAAGKTCNSVMSTCN